MAGENERDHVLVTTADAAGCGCRSGNAFERRADFTRTNRVRVVARSAILAVVIFATMHLAITYYASTRTSWARGGSGPVWIDDRDFVACRHTSWSCEVRWFTVTRRPVLHIGSFKGRVDDIAPSDLDMLHEVDGAKLCAVDVGWPMTWWQSTYRAKAAYQTDSMISMLETPNVKATPWVRWVAVLRPDRVNPVAGVVNYLTLFATILAVWSGWKWLRACRKQRGKCKTCSYPIGDRMVVCPECGTPTHIVQPTQAC
jgi:hypothetical protein